MPLSPGDVPKPTPPDSGFSLDCLTAKDPHCRSGFPFFRKAGVASWASCARLCEDNFLDVAAVVRFSAGTAECRCGVTAKSTSLFDHPQAKAFRASRVFDITRAAATVCGSPGGYAEVYVYVGEYEDGAIPFSLSDTNVGSMSYVDAILTGDTAPAEEDADDIDSKLALGAKEILASAVAGRNGLWVPPRCYPFRCAAGKPWKMVPPQSVGRSDQYEKIALIEYFF